MLPNVHPGQPAGQRQLQQAFDLFNQLSQRLEEAYGELELKAAGLENELRAARLDRESKRQQTTELLAQLPVGVMTLSATGTIDEANPAAYRMLNQPLVGTAWEQILQLSCDPTGTNELVLQNQQRYSITYRPIADGCQVLLLVDNTEVHALKTQLTCQQRLVELGDMAARAVHQIRTPVASAMLYASELQDHQSEPTRSTAGKIVTNLKHLSATLEDLALFTADNYSGDNQDGNCQIGELIHKTLVILPPHMQPLTDISTNTIDTELYVMGEVDRLAGMLSNLIQNAIEAGASQVKLDLSSMDKGRLEIRITDNGDGMSSKIQQQAFQPFYTTKSRGTGLGLAIAQSAAARAGGAINIRSSSDQGTEIQVFLAQCHSPQSLTHSSPTTCANTEKTA